LYLDIFLKNRLNINSVRIVQTTFDNMDQFQALFDFATIGIIVTNKEGSIVNFNRYAEVQFGYAASEVIGKTVEALLPAEIHNRHIAYRDIYYQKPEPRKMGEGRDLFAQHKNGETFPVEVSLSQYTLSKQTYVIAFVIDISVRKGQADKLLQQKAELEKNTSEITLMNTELEQKVQDRTKMLREALKELEKSKEELNEALQNERELGELKSAFVTMASHEFRTPLSTILSSSYLLEKYNEEDSDGRVQKHLIRIKSAVGGMKNILEDFLSLGKLEEGLVKTHCVHNSVADIKEMLQQLATEMKALAKPRQRFELKVAITRVVEADPNLLKNILYNLLSNAIKFSLDDGLITLTAYETNGQFVLEVNDNGIGISPEEQEHLFERFFRAKNAVNIQGTGLGLHIVLKYVQLLNGTITLNSRLNEGTTCTIFIPQNLA